MTDNSGKDLYESDLFRAGVYSSGIFQGSETDSPAFQNSINVGLSAVFAMSAVHCVVTRGSVKKGVDLIISVSNPEDVGIAPHDTLSIQQDVLARRADWAQLGSDPQLGDSISAPFPNGARKTLIVTANGPEDRAFRHMDPSGEFIRVHTTMMDSQDATLTEWQ